MKLEPTSYFVNNVVTLKDSVQEFLRQRHPEECDASKRNSSRIQGGILSDIRYTWLSKGSKIEIIHTKTGIKIAAWSFGTILHDFETCITCVTELPATQGRLPVLIIGLECEIGGGMVCMFDINSSRVIRAIQINDRVTSVHVVNAGCDTSFPGALRALDGVLAVGTAKGKVFLIDLCKQFLEDAIINNGLECVRDEVNACHLIQLSYFDLKHLDRLKEESVNSGNHLAVQLNELSTAGIHFALHAPNGETRLHANMEEVTVSALYYCPQLGSLLVGYNFGAFQLYNLLNIELEYTSPVYEDCIPITNFAVQEPCDDPRAFCYVWVVYNITENGVDGFPMAVMYAFAYNTKDFLEGYGHLYQEFTSCSVRFQLELRSVPGFRMNSSACTGARCISLRSYSKPIVNRQCASFQDSPDEKLALCSIVWTVWNQNLSSTETYLSLFDLNQWYKEQMPSLTRLEDDANSYMSCESLSELFGLSTEDGNVSNLLDVQLDQNSLSPFVCSQRLEEHYYPAALSFKAVCVKESSLIWFGNHGVQRHLLTQLEQAGPLRLIRPSDLFHRCISLGLTPLYTDVPYGVSTPLNVQREMILSVALEHQLVRWLCHCARDWSNGSQSMAGCTLDMLLDWAWQRANTLKFQSDKLCIPLFDYSGLRLDANALIQLNHCACQIKHLTTLFETVVEKCTTYLTEQDVEDIRYQWHALQMISTYLEVLQWLLNVGLLPECPMSMYPLPDEFERISAPYPSESLAKYYASRRKELYKIESGKEYRSTEKIESSNLLFIDNLINIECKGNILHKQWECDGGNGLYPPPSLQALLRVYLIEDIDIVHKHCLFIYFFLDLAMILDHTRYKTVITHLIKFPTVFKISSSLIKITQAFWQLDHGDFTTAMTQFLDPSINNEDLSSWHHRIVLKALLLQGQHQHALLYQQIRKPPVSNVQDICIIITLLIVNDLLQEAFHFQRQNRSNFNEKEILTHFFTICDKMNQLASVLHLPLCPIEEKQFTDYLKLHPEDKNKNFLVIYYLQRDRYGEAFEINDFLNNNEILKQGLLGQQNKNFRNAVVTGFKKTLPEVTQILLDYCKKEKEKINSCRDLRQTPIPMSVIVHESTGNTKYKSTLIQTSLQKAKEIWTTQFTSPNKSDLNETPFISTPKILPSSTKRNESSIIYPSIRETTNMEHIYDNLEEDATPAKRIKLSPRRSINDNPKLEQFRKRLSCYNSDSLLSTPIVKRKSIRSEQSMNDDVYIPDNPPSILKVRSFIRNSLSSDRNIKNKELRETSVTPELIDSDQQSDVGNDSGIIPLDTSAAAVIKSLALNMSEAPKRSSYLGISPRRPIPRTPRPVVHFEDMSRSHSRSSNESGKSEQNNSQLKVHIEVHREQTPDKTESMIIDSKNSSKSTDDVFYSPNTSLMSVSDNSKSNNTTPIQHSIVESIQVTQNDQETRRSSVKRKADESNTSIRSRRSYKSTTPVKTTVNVSLRSRKPEIVFEPSETIINTILEDNKPATKNYDNESSSVTTSEAIQYEETLAENAEETLDNTNITTTPVNASLKPRKSVLDVESKESPARNTRMSLRSRSSLNKIENSEPKVNTSSKLRSRDSLNTPTKLPETISESPKLVPRISGRRSLSRQVMENNMFTKVINTPRVSTQLSVTNLPPADSSVGHKIGVEVSYSKNTTLFVERTSNNKTEETCKMNKIEKVDEYSTKKDADTSKQIIKHVHNEIQSRSSIKKVTEILDEDSMDTEENILSSGSDISDSEASHFYENKPVIEKRYSILSPVVKPDKSVLISNSSQVETMERDDFVQNNSLKEISKTSKEQKVLDQNLPQVETMECDDNIEKETLQETPVQQKNIQENVECESDESEKISDQSDEEEKISDQSEEPEIISALHKEAAKISNQLVEAEKSVICVETENTTKLLYQYEETDKLSKHSDEAEKRSYKSDEDEKISNQSDEEEKISNQSDEEEKISNQSDEEEKISNQSDEEKVSNQSDEEEKISNQSDEDGPDNIKENSDEEGIENTKESSDEEIRIDSDVSSTQDQISNEEYYDNAEKNSDQDEDEMEEEHFIDDDESNENLQQVYVSEDSKSCRSSDVIEIKSSSDEENSNDLTTLQSAYERNEGESRQSSNADVEEYNQNLDDKLIEVEHIDYSSNDSKIEETVNDFTQNITEQYKINNRTYVIKPAEKDYIAEYEQNTLEFQTEEQNMSTSNEQVSEFAKVQEDNITLTSNNIENNELIPPQVIISEATENIQNTPNEVTAMEVSEENMEVASTELEKNVFSEIVSMEVSSNEFEKNMSCEVTSEIIELNNDKNELTETENQIEETPDTLEQNIIENISEIKEDTVQKLHDSDEKEISDINSLEKNVIEDPEITSEQIILETTEKPSTLLQAKQEENKPARRITRSASQQFESNISREPLTVAEVTTEVIKLNNDNKNETENQIRAETPDTLERNIENISEINETTVQKLHESDEKEISDINPLEKNVIEESEITSEELIETVENPSPKDAKQKENKPARRNVRSTSQQSESNKSVTQPSSRVLTRKRSASIDVEAKDISNTEDIFDNEAAENKPTLRVLRKRSVSVDVEEKIIQEKGGSSKVIEDEKPSRRTRRATSVDIKGNEVNDSVKTSKRGQSLEPDIKMVATPTKRGRKRSVQVDVIEELTEPEVTSIPDKIEEYSTTHRLTRHQKMVMKKSLELQEKKKLENPNISQIDPIKLLDRGSFAGSPDKEEKSFQAVSPASSVSTQSSAYPEQHGSPPSTPKRRRGRPSLAGSSKSSISTPEAVRTRRRSFTQAQQAMSTPPRIRRSSRAGSHEPDEVQQVGVSTTPRTRRSSRAGSHEPDEASDASSVMSVPVVQMKPLSNMETRHRSLSPSALKEETATTSRRRSTRTSILPLKTDLSKINEESTSVDEVKEETKPKRGRAKKSDIRGSSQSENIRESQFSRKSSTLGSSSRRSSYKPLENYLPEHAIVKTRRTFNIRKFSRSKSP